MNKFTTEEFNEMYKSAKEALPTFLSPEEKHRPLEIRIPRMKPSNSALLSAYMEGGMDRAIEVNAEVEDVVFVFHSRFTGDGIFVWDFQRIK